MDEVRKQVLKTLEYGKEETINVVPIIRKSGWLPQNHDAEFLNQGAKFGVVVPTEQGRLKDPLKYLKDPNKQKNSKVDRLAKDLGLEGEQDLNPLKPTNNFWKNRDVTIKREGLILNTQDPYDYINLCILLSDEERIAPSWGEKDEKFTYKFAIVRKEDEAKEESENYDTKSKAYEVFNNIKNNIDALDSVMWLRYYRLEGYTKPAEKLTKNWAKAEIGKMVENRTEDFLTIAGADNFQTQVMVYKGLKYKILVRDGQMIKFVGSDTPIGLFDETIQYLDDEKHEDEKRILQEKIEKAEQ